MDNKQILELIKKDIDELKQLVESLQNKEHPEQLLIEIATSKAKTLLQEFELIGGTENKQIKTPVAESKFIQSEKDNEIIKEERDKISDPKPIESKEVEPENEEKFKAEVKVEEEKELEQILVEEEIKATSDNTLQVDPEIEFETVEVIEEKQKLHPEEPIKEEQTIEPDIQSTKILGEQFKKEPSLHDRLASGKQQESKIKGKPITSLKSAIGLNDKFLYIRKLFNNNSEQFNEAINALDQSESILQAIEYLEQNFEWQKNETSFKFMELIKKRFEN
ncbi:MAG: hypothetical protein PF541_10170 [Prolixibacteraceae bacterium]|jgi:hypothetical protein|nr:hypothetical protein [Prolixibacteraceae bacterium]